MSTTWSKVAWSQVAALFGLTGTPSPLPGERTLNARLDDLSGTPRAVLKLHRAQDLDDARLETYVLSWLAREEAMRDVVPRPLLLADPPARAGAEPPDLVSFEGPDGDRVARAISWMPGRTWAQARPDSVAAAWHLGALVARVDAALIGAEHPAGDRPLMWNPLQHKRVRDLTAAVLDPQLRADCETALDAVGRAHDQLVAMPQQLLHADANPANVMVEESGMPTALVDFGDVCRGPRVAGLSIAIAYLEGSLPAQAWALAAAAVGGYHRICPLSEAEIALIPILARARLATSAVMAAVGHAADPDNAYLLSSQDQVVPALTRLLRTYDTVALARLRHAAGYPPSPGADAVRAYLLAAQPKPLLGVELTAQNSQVLDWSGPQDVEQELELSLDRVLLGRYLEDREVYTTAAFVAGGGEARTVHIAVDVFAPAGSIVYAPLDGVIEAAADNDVPLDYGPVVVLRHEPEGVPAFFTLYGHLSRDSLDEARPGRVLRAGEAFARIGDRGENGGWAPHVHLQVSTHLGAGTDADGVVARSDLGLWSSLSLNPDLVLRRRLDPAPGASTAELAVQAPWPWDLAEAIRAMVAVSAAPWPSIDALIAERQRRDPLSPSQIDALAGMVGALPPDGAIDARIRLRRSAGTAAPGLRTGSQQGSPNLIERRRAVMGGTMSPLFYNEPLEIVRGEGVWLFDRQGRRFLDGYNNVAVVGHSHPVVVRAISEQAARLHTHSRYLHPNVVELAERLVASMPADSGLDTVFFTTSGTEANELAWRLATAVTGSDGAIIGSHAYHGASKAMADLSSNEWPVGYRPEWVGTFEGPVQPLVELDADAAAGRIAAAAADLGSRGHRPAMVIADSMFTSEGARLPAPDFMAGLVDAAHAGGALYVADEVQIGFGRTGPALWWFAQRGMRPDIVTLGKPMGAGYPIGAVITRREVAQALGRDYEYFSTFAANPVGSAAALAVLDLLQDGGIAQQAVSVGESLRAAVAQLAQRHPVIGEVRGHGLIAGIDLPDRMTARAVVEGLKQRAVLVGSTGRAGNVLKVRPPLVWGPEHVQLFVEALDDVLAASQVQAG